MKHRILVLSLCVAGIPVLAADALPPAPHGWKTIKHATGNLDRDGLADAALVFEQDDPAKIKKNDVLGPEMLNTNPRRLVVYLARDGGYIAVDESTNFLPTEGSEDVPCLEDPLSDIEIRRGVLKVTLAHSTSCGNWTSSSTTYTFRQYEKGMRLIGEDKSAFHRGTGAKTEVSVNYLTGRRKTTTGLDEFEDATAKVAWDTVPDAPRYLHQL